ncbi:MAG: FAD-dependent oxidoreductase [Acinetobacter sp.]|nr:FAD-dependent oxidoreductase [Acinetobacter sp.]
MYYDIVIVGGGAGGLELAAKLGRKFGKAIGTEKVLLIDRSMIHIWKPTLHEVAVGTLDPQQEGLLYTTLARRNHFSFRLGALKDFHPQQKMLTLAPVCDDDGTVLIPESEIQFGRCVLAIGSGSNSFGTQGFEHAFVLENIADAQHFQKYLFSRFLQTAHAEQRELNVAIVGAGATGVELSAEMMEAYQEMQQITANHFDINIHLIEAAPRILIALDEKVSKHASDVLQQKNIHLHTSTQVKQLTPNAVISTQDEHIPAEIIIWTAGIKAAESNTHYGLATNRIHQFIVNARLETTAQDVYALGDCADLEIDGKKIPATAQAAHQQADYLVKCFWAMHQGKTFEQNFHYADAGALVTLGNNKGVGSVITRLSGNSLFIQGMIAKYAHIALHLMHHKAILGLPKTILLTLARLVQKRVSGRLKLH